MHISFKMIVATIMPIHFHGQSSVPSTWHGVLAFWRNFFVILKGNLILIRNDNQSAFLRHYASCTHINEIICLVGGQEERCWQGHRYDSLQIMSKKRLLLQNSLSLFFLQITESPLLSE